MIMPLSLSLSLYIYIYIYIYIYKGFKISEHKFFVKFKTNTMLKSLIIDIIDTGLGAVLLSMVCRAILSHDIYGNVHLMLLQ
jgi:hypothetical protein